MARGNKPRDWDDDYNEVGDDLHGQLLTAPPPPPEPSESLFAARGPDWFFWGLLAGTCLLAGGIAWAASLAWRGTVG